MSRKIFSHSIVGLLFAGTVAGVTVSNSGCSASVEQQALSESREALGRIDAQPQTRTETGIEGWVATREGAGIVLDGRSAQGLSIHQVRLQPFSTTVTEEGRSKVLTGFTITSSGGGFIRVASDARVLEYRADTAAFPAFARDMEALHTGDVTLDCSWWRWIACAGSVAGAIVACAGPGNLACIFGILSAFGCIDCFCQQFDCFGGGGGGGRTPVPCPGQVDCGDGRFVCPPQVCP